ncbi:MAG: DUF2490 domain-containing protein [Bernardetiaceae bacterium]|jgi:hypothetical protein|nr:DUF2490 domain-containing protein [Bernardetiaceae bacterium]
MKVLLLFFVLTGAAATGLAQTPAKETTHLSQTWLAYFNQTRLSNRWGLWAETHLRTRDELVSGLTVGLVRVGLTYYLADQTKLSAGYAYVHFFPGDNHPGIYQPENRYWQQLQWHTQYKKVRTMQWLRLEERFKRRLKDDDEWAEGYNFNFRVRYNLSAQFPLSQKGLGPKTLSLVASNEVFVNFGREIVYNYFDQNRLFLGFSYQFNKQTNLQFGYMNVFQQLGAGNRYRSANALRLFLFQNLDWRKKS